MNSELSDQDTRARCQHCPALADERSFMCEDCAGEADAEVQRLRDQNDGLALALQMVANGQERLREALRTIEQRATYGYQDLNSGGVLASVRRVAHDALASDET